MAEFGPVVEALAPGESVRIVVPQKLPLGGKVKGKKQPGLFRVYMPSREGGKLTLETSAGQIEVRDPSGKPAKDASGQDVAAGKKVEFEVPQGTFGWYGLIVTGSASYELSSKLTVEGAAKDKDGSPLVPWHFYYFPFTEVSGTHPSKKWEDHFKVPAFAFESASYFQSQIDSGGREAGGRKGHAITREFVDKFNEFAGKEVVKFDDCWWWGHCDAAAAASAIFTQPEPTQGFTEADLEWAATEIAMRGYSLELRFFLGGLGNTSRSHPSHTEKAEPKEGQSVDRDIGPFHEALVRTLKNEAAVCVMDFRADFAEGKNQSPDVWNQAVYKFVMEAEQAEEDGPGKDEVALARNIRFKTTLHANADTAQSAGNPEEPKGSGWDRDLHYSLFFDAKGKVEVDNPRNNFEKVDWSKTGKEYYPPRYIFKVKGLGGSGGPGNPHVSLQDLASLGVTKRPAFGG